MADWFAEATANTPTTIAFLEMLKEHGSFPIEDLPQIYASPHAWLEFAQMLRAGYVREGRDYIHLTASGLEALKRSA